MIEDLTSMPDYQVLAACLRVGGAITKFAEKLQPEDVGFIHGYNGMYQIYKGMLEYASIANIDIIDPIAFEGWLLSADSDILDSIGGLSGFKDLRSPMENIELPDVDQLIEVVKFRASKRRRLDQVQELNNLLKRTNADTTESRNSIAKLTEEIGRLSQDLNYDPLAKVRTANDILANVGELMKLPPFIPTCFPSLNRALAYDPVKGGMMRGGIYTLAGISGMGKSTLAKCLMNGFLDHTTPEGELLRCLFINFEEAEPHWERTVMTQIIEKNVYAAPPNLHDIDVFKSKMEFWGDRLMVRHDPETLFFEDLEMWLRDIIGYGKSPDVVFIDTIQSMFTKTGGRSRWGEFEQIMVRLEKLAKDMDAVFILTAQQNINSTKEKREAINQSDMGGSITITQKSTATIYITPQRANGDGFDTAGDRVMEAQIPKNRIAGTTFSESPALLLYRDDIKSYVELDIEEVNPNYNNDYIERDNMEVY